MDFLSTLTQNSFVAKYVAAFGALNSLLNQVESSAVPADGPRYPGNTTLATTLSSLKASAAAWPNNLAPLCQSTPASIVQWNPQLENDLTLLIGYSKQSQPFSADVKAAIAKTAEQMLGIMQQSSTQISSLSTGLSGLATALTSSDQQLQAGSTNTRSNVASYNAKIAQLNAQLHQLESASKPDKSKIAAVQQQISSVNGENVGAIAWVNELQALINETEQAIPSVQFLATYWQAAGADFDHVTHQLEGLTSTPDNLLSIQLTVVQKSWQEIYQNVEDISKELG